MRRFKVLQKLTRQNVDRWPDWDIVLELNHRETDPEPRFALSYTQMEIDWDDGQDPVVYTRTSSSSVFTYSGDYPVGTHIVKIKVTNRYSNSGTLYFGNASYSATYQQALMPQIKRVLKFDVSGTVNNRPKILGLDLLFNRCVRLESVDCEMKIGQVITMAWAFRFCTHLAGKIVISNASGTLQNLTSAFPHCLRLEEIRFGDLPSLTNLTSAFASCFSLRKVRFGTFGKPVTWHTAFWRDANLTEVKWDGHPEITNLNNTFYVCSSLEEMSEIGDQPRCTSLNSAFYMCTRLKTVKLGSFPECTDIASAFERCTVIDHIHLSGLQNVQNAAYAFYICRMLSDVSIEGFGPNATSLSNTFNGCFDLAGEMQFPDMPHLTNLASTFAGTQLTSIEIGDCPLLTNIGAVVANIRTLETFRGGQWPIVYAANMAFAFCPKLETLELHIPDNTISQASEMFAMCVSLKRLEGEARLRDTGPTNASYFNNICLNCFSLEELPNIFPSGGWAAAFAVPTATFTSAFQGCFSLKGTVPRWIWEDWGGNKTAQNSCFDFCYQLDNYSEIPDLWKGGNIEYSD